MAKIRKGIYRSKEDPSLGLFLIVRSIGGGWAILSCTESGYPNSAAATFRTKDIDKYELIKEFEDESK